MLSTAAGFFLAIQLQLDTADTVSEDEYRTPSYEHYENGVSSGEQNLS